MPTKLAIFQAAAELALANQEYAQSIFRTLHGDDETQLRFASEDELKKLAHLRSRREEAESRFFSLWAGDHWKS